MTIVRSTYRYKRTPRKRKAVALGVPAIVTRGTKRLPAAEPTQDEDRKSAIVTAKHPRRSRFGDAEDLTPEEVNRRRDAADALWRELKRQITEKLRRV